MTSVIGKSLAGMSIRAVTAAEKGIAQPAAVRAIVTEASSSQSTLRSARTPRYPYTGGFRRRTPAERERRAIARASVAPPAPSTVTEYPFSSNVVTMPRATIDDPRIGRLRDGQVTRGVMASVSEQLRLQYDPDGRRTALFSRKSPECLPPGSVLTVDLWNDAEHTTSSSFSGVVIAIRRRSTSTSFVLRSIVAKTGVEVRYNLYSPMIRGIKVIARADGNRKASPLRRFRRAKLYFLREQEKRLPNVVRFTQAYRVKEEAEKRARETKAAADAEAAKEAAKLAKKQQQQQQQEQTKATPRKEKAAAKAVP